MEKYSSKIIKAGALVSDTRLLFLHWQEDVPIAENLAQSQQKNIFGKASRARIENILTIFRQRYLSDESTQRALVHLTKGDLPDPDLPLIMYFHAAQSDLLLHDVVIEFIAELAQRGRMAVSVEEIAGILRTWNNEGKMTSRWGEGTIVRVAQGISATLRDFGILEGSINKRLATLRMPLATFAYVAYCLHRIQPSGHRLLHHPDWKLYLLSTDMVETLFIEAHQQGLLEYQAAGSTIRITFPADTLEAYADVILRRTT